MRWGAASEWRPRASSLYLLDVEKILDAILDLPLHSVPNLRRGLLDIGLVVDEEVDDPGSGVREPRVPLPQPPVEAEQ